MNILKNKKPKSVKEKTVKLKKVYTREEIMNKFAGYITALITILSIGVLTIFTILWVNLTKADSVNHQNNLSLKMLYGIDSFQQEMMLLFGLVMFTIGILIYASSAKKVKPIGLTLAMMCSFIGVILINSIPGLIIGLIIIGLQATRIGLKFNDFKTNILVIQTNLINSFNNLKTKKSDQHVAKN